MFIEKRKNFIYIFLSISIFIIISLILNQILSSIYLNRLAYLNHQKITNNSINVTKNAVYYYLYNIEQNLKILAGKQCVAVFCKDGELAMKEYYNNFTDIYSGLSRIDSLGVIVYTFPFYEKTIGRSVLYQPHNALIFKTREPVISSPFMTVQGYKAIALVVPVIYKEHFYGTVTGLIPFDRIWNLFVAGMNLNSSSFVIMADEKGDFIYAPEFLSDITNISDLSTFLTVKDSTNMFRNGRENETVDVRFRKHVIKNSQEEDFVLIKASIDLNNQKWYIYDFTPQISVFSMQKKYFYSQIIFIYLGIVLLAIIAIVFIFIQDSTIERNVKIVAKTINERESIKRQKGFIEEIVKSLNLIKEILIIVTDSSFRVIYSNNESVKNGRTVFTVIRSRDDGAVVKGFEYILRNGKASSISTMLLLEGEQEEYILNIASISYENETFMMITGFKKESQEENSFLQMNQTDEGMIAWMRKKMAICVIDRDGRIVAANCFFHDRFPNASFINEIGDDNCIEKVENSAKRILDFSSTQEAVLCETCMFNIKMRPIISNMAKIDFISVEII